MSRPATRFKTSGKLEIEYLLSEDELREEVDELASDPIHDRIPHTRSSRGAGRLFQILDDIQVASLRSRSYEERGAE